MEQKHFVKADQLHGGLDAVLPALDEDTKKAQITSALKEEFPELQDSDVASLVDNHFVFIPGHFEVVPPPVKE